MKKVTVIGSGNAFNMDGRAHACYLLEDTEGDLMLMDFGATSLLRMQENRIDAGRIDYLILTHFHGDHFLGLPFLLLHLDLILKRKKEFIILGPEGVQSVCTRLMDLAYPGLEISFPLVYREITTSPVNAGRFIIRPFPINHRPESLGYAVSGSSGRIFSFSGDSRFDDNLLDLIAGSDLAVIELSLEEQEEGSVSHVSLGELINGRNQIRAKRIVFSHIYDDLAAKARRAGIGESARDGMEFFL